MDNYDQQFSLPMCRTQGARIVCWQTVSPGTNEASQFVVLNIVMLLLLNEILCKQRDPHIKIEFDYHEK